DPDRIDGGVRRHRLVPVSGLFGLFLHAPRHELGARSHRRSRTSARAGHAPAIRRLGPRPESGDGHLPVARRVRSPRPMTQPSTLKGPTRGHVAPLIRDVTEPRVAFLIETDILGGAEQMLVHLAGALRARGWVNVAFLLGGREGWLTRALEAADVPVEHLRFGQPFSPRFARDLADAFRRHEITVAHSHEFAMACYGAWAARRIGIPHL